MRLRDARRISLKELLEADRIAENGFGGREARLDGVTLESALIDAGIELTGSPMENLVARVLDGPLLGREEMAKIVENEPAALFDGDWTPLPEEEMEGNMAAFHELDAVLLKEERPSELRPVAAELDAGAALGPLLISAKKIRAIVEDARDTEKRTLPVFTEAEDDTTYAGSLDFPASVAQIQPTLATAAPTRELREVCGEVGVDLVDMSPAGLEDMGLDVEIRIGER